MRDPLRSKLNILIRPIPEKKSVNLEILTKTAVKLFQKKHRLNETGILDASTRFLLASKLLELHKKQTAAQPALSQNAVYAEPAGQVSIPAPFTLQKERVIDLAGDRWPSLYLCRMKISQNLK
ncbi:peptidoglycan-binding domain-containing protein [Fictibacillus sp. KU28468]|uniref:peptidoglycan-binding domain-containing protein n=1 Tax=Fictibacillus sp. KU28468 TaxID=2991053 RepID=UPI00223E360C|nr:peptidoglycan-binding domain-containing protein [Fictibacillus sp. KU28468]UZJ79650.1 peptidoglycan-binding protein [Fictibacillus sp. KU28468]